jgi:AcrR family transcriptional regulator
MTASLRERRKQMLRDEILDAARALLAEKGYAAMSMDDLAARVGVSKPTLYSHFATRDELIVAAATYLMERIISFTEAGIAGETPLRRLERLLYHIVYVQVEEGALSVQLVVPEVIHLLHKHSDARVCMERMDAAVVALVQEAIAAGEINPAFSIATVMRVFLALCFAPFTTPHSSAGPPNPATIARELSEIFVRGVQAGD